MPQLIPQSRLLPPGVTLATWAGSASITTVGVLSAGSIPYALVTGGPSPYTLPTADGSTLGGVKVGSGLSIDGSGVLSASGSAGGADPTGTVGLTAVNGVATTFLRSDAAPALSQAIAPTWTGRHVFAGYSSSGSVQIGFVNASDKGLVITCNGGSAAVSNALEVRNINNVLSLSVDRGGNVTAAGRVTCTDVLASTGLGGAGANATPYVYARAGYFGGYLPGGPVIQLQGTSSTANNRARADVDAEWIDSTDATRKARLVLRAWDTSAREGIRIDADGGGPRIGFYGTAAVARQVLATGAGATADDVITALQNLGLVSQS